MPRNKKITLNKNVQITVARIPTPAALAAIPVPTLLNVNPNPTAMDSFGSIVPETSLSEFCA